MTHLHVGKAARCRDGSISTDYSDCKDSAERRDRTQISLGTSPPASPRERDEAGRLQTQVPSNLNDTLSLAR